MKTKKMEKTNNHNKEELTLNDLAQMIDGRFEESRKHMDGRFEESDKLIDKKLEKLATSIQNELLELKDEIKEVKSDTENIKTNLNKKVDRFEHNELSYRVEELEKKFA